MNDSQKFTGYICWQPDRIHQVINREAVQTERAAFLATHAPIHHIAVERSEEQLASSDDAGVFSMLRNRAEHDRHGFVVLKGIPGTGKSHLIRWWKERFTAHFGTEKELVLLIRRDNSSLNSTLKQILSSDIFDNERFREQRRRLETASGALTSQAVTNQLLNNLQEAARAVRAGELSAPGGTKPVISRYMPDFLLSPDVRGALEKEHGAARRIATFLSGDGRTLSKGEEMPGFADADFEFDEVLNNRLEMSDSEATRTISQKLYVQSFREDAAHYLNSLLNHAVGRLTSISTDELKQMFTALRRELRLQKRGLALFIEDITAFTGLDEALVDVLATQHTGENDDLCRLVSVIGITDNYYDSRFPDNMKQRVTYLMSLNDQGGNALTLSNPSTAGEMSGRYLNAIRMSQAQLQTWDNSGADPSRLSSACTQCQFRRVCHAAFGAVELESGEYAGLYPFNNNAIWTMVNGLPEIERTPRGMLSSVLAYVLQSHGRKLAEKRFPPAPKDVGADFYAPGMKIPAQRQIIQEKTSPADGARLESVIIFWGDRTITPDNVGEVRVVGGLNRDVYEAFALPFIETAAPRATTTESVKPISETSPATATRPETRAAISPKLEAIHNEIEQWLRRVTPLESYNTLVNWLVTQARSAINWSAYDVHPSLVEDRIRQQRVGVEDQSGRINSKIQMVLPRSDRLALALHAAADFQFGAQLTASQRAGHLTALSAWVRDIEPTFVAFAKRPPVLDISLEQVSLTDMLSIDMLIVTALHGGMVSSDTGAKEKLGRILALSGKRSEKAIFTQTPALKGEARSNAWRKLASSLERDIKDLRDYWLGSLNCPQGESNEVLFIDTHLALRALRSFAIQWVKDGRLRALDLTEVTDPALTPWKSAIGTYRKLELGLQAAIDEELQQIETLRSDVEFRLGDKSPKEVIDRLKAFQLEAEQSRYAFQMPSLADYPAGRLESALRETQPPKAFDSFQSKLFWISGMLKVREELSRYSTLLTDLSTKLDRSLQLERAESQSEADAELVRQADEIRTEFDALIQRISDWAQLDWS